MDSILQEKIVAIKNAIDLLKKRSRYATGKARLGEISYYLQDPKIWENPERFTQLTQEQSILKKSINQIHLFEKDLEDSIELFALAELESDLIVQKDMSQHLVSLLQEISDATFESLLSDPIDHHNCFLELHAGAGGTESQDWTLMLMRMYLRWSDNHGYTVKILDESAGEEAGIKSAYIRIEGYNAYGWLKLEAGVHRLVRISPFDSNARRHTSFASVNAYPDVPDVIEIDLQDKDLKIDTYRASGAGGQHVNKTDSAVRITHLPTGVVVQCQNDRSQHKNKIEALRMLKSKLYNLERQKREETRDAMYEQQTDIAWGYQIRSYVMHPYQMVKDLRTNEQSNQVQKVLDGDIDSFLKAMLVYEHRD